MSYDRDLLDAAKLLIERTPGERGRPKSARVRRSVSTAYYALFHFLLEQAAATLIGSTNDVSRRRRAFMRSFDHNGIKMALDKVKRAEVDPSVAEFMSFGVNAIGPVISPAFARSMATAFADAKASRHDADYDRNKLVIVQNATQVIERVEQAIEEWRASTTRQDRDFKKAICMLMLLQGKVRNS